MEVLSWLPVKSLVRFTCASQWFQSLISDSSFVKLHLQRSPKSEDFLLICSVDDTLNRFFILSCPAIPLVSDDPLSLIADDHSLGLELNDTYEIAGACNGLRSVCLANVTTTRWPSFSFGTLPLEKHLKTHNVFQPFLEQITLLAPLALATRWSYQQFPLLTMMVRSNCVR